LADEYLLYTKTRNFHWNVVGPHFNELHKFFETQYELLDQAIDDIAERARALGENAVGTLTKFLKLTSLHEQSAQYGDAHQMLSVLCADHETIIRGLRKGIEACAEEHRDAGTADFLTGLMRAHEKMAWMLRAFLK
jgi:starvation-inducible DNA-binding protein